MRQVILAVLGALLAATAGWSADVAPPLVLDLPQSASLAIERSLVLQSAREDTETARQIVLEAQRYGKGKAGLLASALHLDQAPAIPTPSVTLPLGPNGITVALPPVQAAPQDLVHLTLQAGYPLYTSGRLPSAIRQAEHGLSAREAVATDTEAQVMLDVTQLYLGALLTRDVVKVNEQALTSYLKHQDEAEKAYAAGVVAKYDVIRAEAAVMEQRKRLTEANNQYELALAALRSALHLESQTSLDLRGAFFEIGEVPKLAEAQALALQQNDLLKAIEEKSGALNEARRVEAAGGKPQVQGVAQVELLTGTIAYTDPGWFVGVQGSVELYDGGVRRAKVAQLNSEQAKALTEHEHARDQIKLAVHSALLDIEAAQSALQQARKTSELAQEALRLASERFAVGVGTSVEVLDANVAVAVADVGERQALYQLDRAYLTLHRYLGDLADVCREVQKS